MQELYDHAYEMFEIDKQDIIVNEVNVDGILILPLADHDLAFDSIEFTTNLKGIENSLIRNKYAYNVTFEAIDKSKPSYALILSTERTIDSTALILKINWI